MYFLIPSVKIFEMDKINYAYQVKLHFNLFEYFEIFVYKITNGQFDFVTLS